MKWTEDITFKFVKEYLRHECLYNTKSRDYRNKSARDYALRKIVEVMNIPGFGIKEVVAKIKSIRSTYSQERKKVNESCKGTDPVYVPCLKWYKLYYDCIKDKGLTQIILQDNLNSVEIERSTPEIDRQSSSPQENEENNLNNSIYSRKRNLAPLNTLGKKVKAVGEMIEKPVPPVQTENEFEIFGKGVAVQLNSMPLIDALQAQTQIQNFLTNIRVQSIRRLEPDSISYSPPPLPSTTFLSNQSPAGEIIISDLNTINQNNIVYKRNQCQETTKEDDIIYKHEDIGPDSDSK